MPYAVVSGVNSSDLKAVQFQYWDESDGVDLKTGTSFPFYPIPPEAITQARWVEGGDPGNVDKRSSQDRHLLIVDRDRNYLYELYNVFYDTAQAKWYAGSGAFFDMSTNNRRTNGWTSADAAGLGDTSGTGPLRRSLRSNGERNPPRISRDGAFVATVLSIPLLIAPARRRARCRWGRACA